ncbi:methyltransferase [Rubrobacter marinus]|uniref:Methyltransferase n=1 Tax=Rubrobacter marinus TaxID=2653852 RepID=A0A6G8PZ06_9ACTN|nr:class I SAM-dependent rRNA methyltransferase [Rubrobacter marinus]QIN79443.1 methyltransferase [Rubrobacter marinus]
MQTTGRAVLKGKGAARARAGHPWIYRSDVAEAEGETGDVVRVTDRAGRSLGRAFYNPHSEISLRIATREDEETDEAWFRGRIERALAYRESLGIDADAYRLVHSEADGLPGLVVDRYGDYLVLQIGSAAVERRLAWILPALGDLTAPAGVLLRGDAASRKKEGLPVGVRALSGEVPDLVVAREGPIRYEARLATGQKTGSFLDQRENHMAAARYVEGAARVLDVFTYAGGFALHAARTAERVEAVDSSGGALDAARRNAELNGLENLTCTRASAFDLLRERSDAGEVYDAVILDPPAFAKTRREVPRATRAYKEINLRAMKMLAPGGVLVTCSCSYHFSRETMEETLRSAAADAGRTMRIREWRGQSSDHPEVLTIPETRYLKCAILERS